MDDVSVILSTYNRQIFLRQAIEGVLKQTYTNFKFFHLCGWIFQ